MFTDRVLFGIFLVLMFAGLMVIGIGLTVNVWS